MSDEAERRQDEPTRRLVAATDRSAFFRSAAPSQPVAHERASQERSLTPLAHDWLAKLPPRYQPFETARRHPHIVNRLSAVWKSPPDAVGYFSDLLVTSRKDREGFYFGVLTELTDLRSFWSNPDATEAVKVGLPGSADNFSQQLAEQKIQKAVAPCARSSDARR